MSKKTELAVFEQTIAIPGVRVSRTGMVFERVDEETLVAAGAFLQAVDGCAAWWWGDFLATYCGYRLTSEEEERGEKFNKLDAPEKLKQYTAHYADIAGREAKTLSHWRGVAEFYNSSRRREELSWSHHIEAKEGSEGDPAVADNWLDLAVKHRWSHAQLRAAIRRAKRAGVQEEEPMPQILLPMEYVECRRRSISDLRRVPDMELVEVQALLAELQPTLALATALAARLEAGGKESFSAAA